MAGASNPAQTGRATAINLGFDHLFDENGIPLESKLKEFDEFLNELLRSYCAMHSVSKNMHGNLKAK